MTENTCEYGFWILKESFKIFHGNLKGNTEHDQCQGRIQYPKGLAIKINMNSIKYGIGQTVRLFLDHLGTVESGLDQTTLLPTTAPKIRLSP